MHEEALLRDLLRKVDEVARDQGIPRVVRVRLWVGALSHFSEPQLRARWALAVPGTVAAEAELLVDVSLDPDDPRASRVILTSLDAPVGGEGA
jgi:hydrogenase nickel incorporation protein HypA/HybF